MMIDSPENLNLPKWLEEIASQLNLTDMKNIPGSDRFVAKAEDSSYVILNTYSPGKKSLIRFSNEIAWSVLNRLDKNLFTKNIAIPRLRAAIIYPNVFHPENLVIVSDYIPTENFFEKFSNGSLTEDEIKNLAKFIDEVEKMSFKPTPVSFQKARLAPSDWEKTFFTNLQNWRQILLERSMPEGLEEILADLTKQLVSTASSFVTRETGKSGLHGRPRFFNYYKENGGLKVAEWDAGTSDYIKYYETTSNISYILVWLNSYDLAVSLLKERLDLLDSKAKGHFRSFFPIVLAQRLLGDLYDIIGKEFTPDGRVVNNQLILDNVKRFLQDVKDII